jgi:hypothetical protein
MKTSIMKNQQVNSREGVVEQAILVALLIILPIAIVIVTYFGNEIDQFFSNVLR